MCSRAPRAAVRPAAPPSDVAADCAPGGCGFTLVVESFFAGGVWHAVGPSGSHQPAAPADGPATATFQLAGNLSQVGFTSGCTKTPA